MASNVLTGRESWRASPVYTQVMERVQSSQWAEATTLLLGLLEDYPDDPKLQSLLAEVELRQETERSHRVRARHLLLPSKRLLFGVLLVMVLLAFVWVTKTFYEGIITPSLAQAAAVQEQEAIFAQARQALAAGDYQLALELYQELSALNPDYPGATDGIRAAQEALSLEEQYNLAQQQLSAGQVAEAQATLVAIQSVAPTYRDVNVLLSRIERRQRLTGLLRQANEAQDAGHWEEAVARLEEARVISPPEHIDAISADLFEAYLALASQRIEACRGEPAEVEQVIDLLNKALALQPQEVRASTRRQWARQYLAGYEAFTDGQWDDAIAQLEPLYKAQPGYVNGRAAQLLYDAYVHSAQQFIDEEDRALVWERYYRACQIKGVDTNGACTMATTLATALTPTPTPTATPTAAPLPTPRPTKTASAAPKTVPVSESAPLASHHGKIAFWSNRGGADELWLMDADGKNAFRAEDQARAQADYERLRATELRSPDGKAELSVAQPEGESGTAIFISGENGALSRVTLLNGTSYDPVWSPTGYWIAFVSNAFGNDEIFSIGANGEGLKRLTENIWEWDKHPSWSAKGDQLAFWSNRDVGRAQIWRMNADGSQAINLSNNEYAERDPLWIK